MSVHTLIFIQKCRKINSVILKNISITNAQDVITLAHKLYYIISYHIVALFLAHLNFIHLGSVSTLSRFTSCLFFFEAVEAENESASSEPKAAKETIDFKELKRVDHILASLQRKVYHVIWSVNCTFISPKVADKVI